MKITLGVAVAVTLVDSPANGAYRNFRPVGRRAAQEAKILRAAVESLFDRGNTSTDLTFEVTTTPFGSIALAESYALGLRATIDARMAAGDTQLNIALANGEVWTLANCVVPTVSPAVQGCTVIVQYQILGPALVQTTGPS